jgi:hypothetical protein
LRRPGKSATSAGSGSVSNRGGVRGRAYPASTSLGYDLPAVKEPAHDFQRFIPTTRKAEKGAVPLERITASSCKGLFRRLRVLALAVLPEPNPAGVATCYTCPPRRASNHVRVFRKCRSCGGEFVRITETVGTGKPMTRLREIEARGQVNGTRCGRAERTKKGRTARRTSSHEGVCNHRNEANRRLAATYRARRISLATSA